MELALHLKRLASCAILATVLSEQSQSQAISTFTADPRGITDRQTGQLIIDVKNPKDLDPKFGYKASKKITAWTTDGSGKRKPAGFKVEYKKSETTAFSLSVDDHNGSIATTLEIFDRNITDADGISPGIVLVSHPSYDWNRRCREKEGVYECSTKHKNLVYILVDGASRFKTRKEAVSSSPVKSLLIQNF